MPDSGATRLLRLSTAGPCGVKWRPTRFATDVVERYVCSLCGVIPRSTQLLPCGHTLCKTCKSASSQDGAGGVCPLDQEHFYDDECNNIVLPARKIDTLKAFCWNEGHGCRFTGALADVLRHYEEDCCYHTVECPRCGDSVPHAGLAPHYSVGCHGTMGTAADHREPPRNDGVFRIHDVTAALEEFKALLREPQQDQLPALQSKMNELSEEVSRHGCLLREMGEMLRRISPEEDRDSGDRMPWRVEQRHILRRLNVLATESLARAQHADAPEALRTLINSISCFSNTRRKWAGIPPSCSLFQLTDTRGGPEAVSYGFSVTNMEKVDPLIVDGRRVLGEVTQWHSEHVYFTMAVTVEGGKDLLEISLRFGHTLESAFPQVSDLRVTIHGDRGLMRKADEVEARPNDLGWQHTFYGTLSRIIKDSVIEDGAIFIEVEFTV